MKDYSPLRYKELKKMDQLLKTPGAVLSTNDQLTELDWLAIKTVNDIIERPNRTFYNLRMFKDQIESPQKANSEAGEYSRNCVNAKLN